MLVTALPARVGCIEVPSVVTGWSRKVVVMAGLHSQSRRKALKRSVEMADSPPPEPAWVPPPEDECAESASYTMTPPTAQVGVDRVKVRMVNRLHTDELVSFALIQQTKHRQKWRDVTIVDTSHGDDVHLHRYGRSTGERVGEKEKLCLITSVRDVQDGYELAYEAVVGDWAENKRRWHDG